MSEISNAVHQEVRAAAQRAKEAAHKLATLSEAERNAALGRMADAVHAAAATLFAANAKDLSTAEARDPGDELSPSTLARLRLSAGKLGEMIDQVRSVAALPDPLGRVMESTELDDGAPAAANTPANAGLSLQKVSVPLGVLAVIFEARPDAVTQIAALALKSGNAVLLKPGKEVEHTAAALVDVLRGALVEGGLPEDAVALLTGRAQVEALLTANDVVDLVIPRGSKALVEYVQANTRIPVLGHSEGVCHIYVDRAADPALALRVIADAKLDYPAACNAVETVLVHQALAPTLLPTLISHLQSRGIRIHAGAEVRDALSSAVAEQLEPVQDWHMEYGTPELAVGLVDSLEAAIVHIHRYGSAHTESILTEDRNAAEHFLQQVDAAGVFHNASTRFADGFRYGFGAEVGISTSKLHARGPVGLEGLTTYKYLLRGHGHVAGDYRGPAARSFTHRRVYPGSQG